jgi:hypothetical protein
VQGPAGPTEPNEITPHVPARRQLLTSRQAQPRLRLTSPNLSGRSAGATPEAGPSGVCVLGWRIRLRLRCAPLLQRYAAPHVCKSIGTNLCHGRPPPLTCNGERPQGDWPAAQSRSRNRETAFAASRCRAPQAGHGLERVQWRLAQHESRKGFSLWSGAKGGYRSDQCHQSHSVRDHPLSFHPKR